MLFFVEVMKRVRSRVRATLRLQFNFLIEACKIKTTVLDTVELAPMLKLVRGLVKERVRFQMGRVFPSKRVNLPWLREYLVFIELNWVNSHAMNKCFVINYVSSVERWMHKNLVHSTIWLWMGFQSCLAWTWQELVLVGDHVSWKGVELESLVMSCLGQNNGINNTFTAFIDCFSIFIYLYYTRPCFYYYFFIKDLYLFLKISFVLFFQHCLWIDYDIRVNYFSLIFFLRSN